MSIAVNRLGVMHTLPRAWTPAAADDGAPGARFSRLRLPGGIDQAGRAAGGGRPPEGREGGGGGSPRAGVGGGAAPPAAGRAPAAGAPAPAARAAVGRA